MNAMVEASEDQEETVVWRRHNQLTDDLFPLELGPDQLRQKYLDYYLSLKEKEEDQQFYDHDWPLTLEEK